nr:hypothetical protein [uncultured Rhodopila sp.]
MTPSDSQLVAHFESITADCEFGFLQRLCNAEPIGLLRFAGVPLEGLTRALRTRFAGIAVPDSVLLSTWDDEYRVHIENFGFLYHTEMLEGVVSVEQLRHLECAKIRILTSRLIEQLESGTKIFVYQQREPMLAQELVRLLSALSIYRRAVLLWVVEAGADSKPGTVEVISERLMVGHLQSFAPPGEAHKPDIESWLAVCRAAYEAWLAAQAVSLPRQTAAGADQDGGAFISDDTLISEFVFASGGNGLSFLADGWWSYPEYGFIWSVGRQSRLILPNDAGGGDMLLELLVRPFVTPALPAQRMTIVANGREIVTFRLTRESRLHCPISVEPGAPIDIVFDHPDAARVADVMPSPDNRVLAVAFSRIWLYRTGNGR